MTGHITGQTTGLTAGQTTGQTTGLTTGQTPASLSQVRGEVLWPDDPRFEAACGGFNLARTHNPDVVIRPTCTGDIIAAVSFAAEHGTQVKVHTSGHGAGPRARGGVLLVTDALREASIDADTARATVCAGTRWNTVIHAAGPYGLMPLCGSSPTVGVIGYTLGGGMSPVGRSYGFASDHVLRAQMVCADGTIAEVDSGSEPELFWGLRGGKLNIGVITKLEFRLMRQSSYYGGGIFYRGADAAKIMHRFVQWAVSLPTESSSSLALLRLPDMPDVPEPLRGRLTVHLRFAHSGDAESGARLIAPMRAVAEPIFDLVQESAPETIGAIHQDPQDPMPAREDSTLLDRMPEPAVDALLNAAGPDADVPLIVVELRHLGGALAVDPAVPSAVSGRDAAFNLTVIGPYPPPLTDVVDRASTTVLDAVRPWSLGRTQANFHGMSGDIRDAWAPDTLARLDALKASWDPDGVFV